jgi:hypothetical protein
MDAKVEQFKHSAHPPTYVVRLRPARAAFCIGSRGVARRCAIVRQNVQNRWPPGVETRLDPQGRLPAARPRVSGSDSRKPPRSLDAFPPGLGLERPLIVRAGRRRHDPDSSRDVAQAAGAERHRRPQRDLQRAEAGSRHHDGASKTHADNCPCRSSSVCRLGRIRNELSRCNRGGRRAWAALTPRVEPVASHGCGEV